MWYFEIWQKMHQMIVLTILLYVWWKNTIKTLGIFVFLHFFIFWHSLGQKFRIFSWSKNNKMWRIMTNLTPYTFPKNLDITLPSSLTTPFIKINLILFKWQSVHFLCQIGHNLDIRYHLSEVAHMYVEQKDQQFFSNFVVVLKDDHVKTDVLIRCIL